MVGLRQCRVCGQQAYTRKGVCMNKACDISMDKGWKDKSWKDKEWKDKGWKNKGKNKQGQEAQVDDQHEAVAEGSPSQQWHC